MIKKKISCCKSKYFFNWGDIGSQNHRGFKCTSQSNIICTLRHVPVTPSKVSFCLHLPPLCPPPTTPTAPFLWGSPHCCLCLLHLCFFFSFILFFGFILSPSFIQSPIPFHSEAFSLFPVSMPLFLFCSLVRSYGICLSLTGLFHLV